MTIAQAFELDMINTNINEVNFKVETENYWADIDDFMEHVERIAQKEGIDRAREYIRSVHKECKKPKRTPLNPS